MSVADELKAQYGSVSKVKRRPLPVNPNQPNERPVVIPDRPMPGRAKHGPRDYSTPPRANSLPPEGPKTFNYPHSQATLFGQKSVGGYASTGPSPAPIEQVPEEQFYGEYDPSLGPQSYDPQSVPAQPDFLPQLRPSSRHRGSMPPQPRYAEPQHPPPQQHLRPQSHIDLPHSHSAPAVPTHPEPHSYDDHQLRTDYPEPIPDVDYQYQQVRQRRHDLPPGWEGEYGSPYSDRQPYIEEELESSPPPPPPIHSNSSPAVPHYGSPHSRPYPQPSGRLVATPPGARQQFVPSSSPLQSIERNYGTPPSHGHPARANSFDEYGDSPYHASYGSTPNLTPPNQQSPPSHGGTPPFGRQHPSRHSVADIYGTPSRPHPLSQEVPRARSPNPYVYEVPGSSPYQHDYRSRDAVPLIKPRAVSPQPAPQLGHPAARPKSSYSIQHPVRAFESSDNSPLSTSQPPAARPVPRALPTRKSVSPRPSMSEGSRIPFSPDSFGVHNPNAPHLDETSPTRNGPIVGWHGQEIDPSDHLPVHSWAPEPEQKVPNKQYGLGRDRDFGPRTQGVTNTAGRVSRDMMINVKTKQPEPVPEPVPEPQPSKIRARLVKKSGGSSPIADMRPPLRDHANFNSVPNPYEQQQYGRGFHEEDPRGYVGPPSLPPKVPLDYGPDALEREIAGIDIGTSSRRPPPASYVPVRSHRDRNSFY